MADFDTRLTAASAFTNWRPIISPGVTIDIRDDLAVAGIAAFADKAGEVAARLNARFGIALPDRAHQVTGQGGVVLQWAGPGQWLVMAPSEMVADLEADVADVLAGVAAVVDHTDSRAILRVSGPSARDVLAKLVVIDLHPRSFTTGDVAITHAAHVGITIVLVDDRPTFEISMFRSFADSFAHALAEAAGAFAHAA